MDGKDSETDKGVNDQMRGYSSHAHRASVALAQDSLFLGPRRTHTDLMQKCQL